MARSKPDSGFPLKLHPFQMKACQHAIESPNKRMLISSPTGTGKSYMILYQQYKCPTSWALIPSEGIIRGMLSKMKVKLPDGGDITDLMIKHRMMTPIKFYNRVMDGTINVDSITRVFKDEAHHDIAQTYDRIDTTLPDYTFHRGTTATPFRATAKGTAALRAKWEDLYVALTYPEAVAQKFISMPKCETWPLVDDDLLEVKGTDFEIVSLCSAVSSKLEDAIVKSMKRGMWNADGTPSKSMIIGVPSSSLFDQVRDLCKLYNLKVEFVNEGTSQRERQRIFRDASDGKSAIVHINVVSEGIDLPLRQYLDLNPTRSSVAFMQRFGRITRYSSEEALYICTNRNLESHGYLLEGCLPPNTFSETQSAFGGPTKRSVSRISGLDSLGKIKPCYTRCMNGITLTFYCVSASNGTGRTHYAVILHPAYQQVLWFSRTQSNSPSGEVDWGRWSIVSPPDKLVGYGSVTPNSLTEKQLARWKMSATKHGLDSNVTPNAKQFQILPVLRDTGLEFA